MIIFLVLLFWNFLLFLFKRSKIFLNFVFSLPPPFCLNPRSTHKKTWWVFDEQAEGRRYFSCMFFPFCLVFQTLFGGVVVICNIISLDYFVLYVFAFVLAQVTDTHIDMLKHTCSNSYTADVVICAAYVFNLFSNQMILTSFHYNRLLF